MEVLVIAVGFKLAVQSFHPENWYIKVWWKKSQSDAAFSTSLYL